MTCPYNLNKIRTVICKMNESVEGHELFDYSGQVLRNFTAQFLDEVLGAMWGDPKSYRSQKRKSFRRNSFITIEELLQNKIKEGFDISAFDNILFNELAWILPDNHFIYMFETSKDITQVSSELNAKTKTFNKPIYNRGENADELQLVSTRQENDTLLLLFRNGLTENEEDKKTIFFIVCELNFTRKTFIIKMRETLRKNSKIPQRTILENILLSTKTLIKDFNLIVRTDKYIKGKIYEMFSNESSYAEKVISQHLPIKNDMLEKIITDFVTVNLDLKDPINLESNCNIIKSMYYQNIAKTVDSKVFNQRYIFAFSFFDGTTTKSITRDAKRNHIYGKDLYWNLKNIVHRETFVNELSMYFKINKTNFKAKPIGKNFIGLELTIREFYGSFMIDFYTDRRDPERRFKSAFIVYELEKYL